MNVRRRTFLLLTLLTIATRNFTKAKENNEILKDVLNHLFPTTKNFKGANKIGTLSFFIYVTKDPSFDKEDLDFLIKGTVKLHNLYPNFSSLDFKHKEKALREFEKTTFGYNWLSSLLNYGLESMLGDPIYKGNKNMQGWKNIAHTIPIPTAKKPFGQLS